MEKKVMAFVDEYQMLKKRDVVIVGVSGGADSVCLLFMLKNLQRMYSLKLHVVHINHCLRGEEANQDAEFVKALCERVGVPYRIAVCDIRAMAAERGISIEEMGRIARYDIFTEEMEKYDGTKIATAHHMDDNAETMLFNLFRGTGIRGLSGISPYRDNVIRPIMCLNRKEIEEYLDIIGETYRNDSSNFCDDYTRNKIRHNIISYARENILEGVSSHMFDTAKQLKNIDIYLRKQAVKIADKIVQYEPYITLIEKDAFRKVDPALKSYVLSIAWENAAKGEEPLSRRHIEAVSKLAEENSGKDICLPNNWIAASGYYHIFFYVSTSLTKCMDEIPIKSSGTHEFGNKKEKFKFKKENYSGEKKKISKATYTKCFDYDKIGSRPVLRTRRENDYIIINSKGDKQSLNRYFINEKIPAKLRDQTILLADGNRIMWVVGFRISEDVKVTEETRSMLIVTREI